MATRRSTRSPDQHLQEIKDVLNAISLKLDTINKIFDGRLIDKQGKDETQETIAKSNNKLQENISIVVNKSKKADLERKVMKQRRSILGTWKKQLNKRKQLHWQSRNCENTSVIFTRHG